MAVNYTCQVMAHLFAFVILLAGVARSFADPSVHDPICSAGVHLNWTGTTNEGDPAPEAVALIERMTEMVGIYPKFEVRAADFRGGGTAFATIRNGRRYIVYDRAKFDWGNGEASYAHLGIMAHEIGHHLASHIVTREASSHARELEADRFAGFAMARLGAGIVEAQHMFRKDWPASRSHPASPDRRAAVREGWLAGKSEVLRHQRTCRRHLISKDLELEGRICRVVNTCDNAQHVVRLACLGSQGTWKYRNPHEAE